MGSSTVRILGRNYEVNLKKRLRSAGECHMGTAVINVVESLDLHERKDTLLHEIMHAVLYQQGRTTDPKVEEEYVRALATGLTAVFQDNPDLAQWLVSPVRNNHHDFTSI